MIDMDESINDTAPYSLIVYFWRLRIKSIVSYLNNTWQRCQFVLQFTFYKIHNALSLWHDKPTENKVNNRLPPSQLFRIKFVHDCSAISLCVWWGSNDTITMVGSWWLLMAWTLFENVAMNGKLSRTCVKIKVELMFMYPQYVWYEYKKDL